MPGATHLAGFDARFLTAKGARIRYDVAGAGQPVILVHGLGGAASNWVEVAPRLAERHRVLVPDLPGHGGSPPLPAAPNLDAYADRVALVAEREGLTPAIVVGHSFGGAVAVQLAARRPDAVAGLVLAAAAGISSATRRAEKALAVVSLVRPGRLASPHRDAIARLPWLRWLVFGYWGASDPVALSPRAVKGFLAGPALHTDTATAAKTLVVDDIRRELGRVRCPSLVLWGARDRQLPVEDAFQFARRLRAPVRVIPDCGHLLIGERPDACADAIETVAGSRGGRT